jgi:hypothetical protein
MSWHILKKSNPLLTYCCEECSHQCIAESPQRPTTCSIDKELHEKKPWEKAPLNSWECSDCDKKCRFHSIIQPMVCLHERAL